MGDNDEWKNQAYMRDYVLNDKGDVKELWFQNIAI